MRYYLLTLGCPKNTVDSEAMAMLLRRQGHEATTDPQRADVLIVNTCGFLQASQDESLAALRELGWRKRRHQLLIAAGCLAQRAADTILTHVPQVDGVLGTRRWVEITTIIERLRAVSARRSRQRYQLLGDPEGPLAAALEPTSRSAKGATLPAPSVRSLASRGACAAVRWRRSSQRRRRWPPKGPANWWSSLRTRPITVATAGSRTPCRGC